MCESHVIIKPGPEVIALPSNFLIIITFVHVIPILSFLCVVVVVVVVDGTVGSYAYGYLSECMEREREEADYISKEGKARVCFKYE